MSFLNLFTRRSTISVVIVAGACGIAAGTPLAILGGIGRAARLGAIIKGGLFLEILGRVNTIILGKTGTLAFGRMELQAVIPVEGTSEAAILEAVGAAELRSEHRLARRSWRELWRSAARSKNLSTSSIPQAGVLARSWRMRPSWLV
jgi:cation transport ATPase